MPDHSPMRDHRMKAHAKLVLAAGLGLAALAGLVGAALAHGDGRGGYADHPMMQRMMQAADGDGDGAITREEMQTHHQSLFAAFDADGDGRVDWTEMRAGMRDRLFAALDADGDNQISRGEFDAMHKGVEGRGGHMMGGGRMMGDGRGRGVMRFDDNEDGALDRAEAARMTDRMFERMDRDGDGRLRLDGGAN